MSLIDGIINTANEINEKILSQEDIDVGFETGVSGAVSKLVSGAIESFFGIVFFVVNIGFSFVLNLIHSTFLLLFKKVRVNFAIDETFFTNNTTQFGRIINIFKDTMTEISLAVIILIVLWQLFKSLFSYMDFDTDQAVKLAGRCIIFSVLIFYAHDIIIWIINKLYSPMVDSLFSLLYDAKVMGIKEGMTLSKMISIIINNIASSLRIDKAAAESLGSFSGLIQGLILVYIDFNVLILLAKFAEKTVVFLLLIIISPVAMACGVSKNTKHIFEGWLKSFVGVLVTYMLYNLILIMVILFMFLQSGGTVVIGSNAYRFIGNTSFVYATGIILGTFALMDQVETIARGLGFNTGGTAIGVSSGINAIGETGRFIGTSLKVGKFGLKKAYRGASVVGKYMTKGDRYLYNEMKDMNARRNLGKYEKALADKQKYSSLGDTKKLKDIEKKIKKLEKKKYVAQFKEFMPGADIGEKVKTLGGTKKLAKRLGELKKESDAKKEIADISSRIEANKLKLDKLQKGNVRERAKLSSEIEMDKDRIAAIKNRIVKIDEANIKSFGRKVNNIDKLLQKNQDALNKATSNEERMKLNSEGNSLRKKREFYENRIGEIENSKNAYIEQFGDIKRKKPFKDRIKNAPSYLYKKDKEVLDNISKYAVKGAWKGSKALFMAGFRSGESKLMKELRKEATREVKNFSNWYKNEGGDEKVKMFAEEVKYFGGKAIGAAMLPIALQVDAVNNLVLKPTKGVWNKIAGSKDGEIRVSTIAKDMVTPTVSKALMSMDLSSGYGRFKDVSDTVEGNLLLNYKDSENKKDRLQEKLNNLQRKEGESEESYQSKVAKLQNDIQREEKRMEKRQEQARVRMDKYESQREELKERIEQKTKEYEQKRNERRGSLTESDLKQNSKEYKEYKKQETELQRMQSKLNKLDQKINVLQEITDGNQQAGARIDVLKKNNHSVDVNVLKNDKQD